MGTNTASLCLLLGNFHAWTGHADVKVHSINTNGGIVFESKINVLLNTKPEIASLAEIFVLQFIFFNLSMPIKKTR